MKKLIFNKILNNSYTSDALWLLIGHATSTLRFLLISFLMAHIFTKDAYGLYAYLISLIAVAGIISMPNIGIAILQSLSRGYHGTFKYLLKRNLLLCLLGSIFLLIVWSYELLSRGNSYFVLVYLAVIYPISNTASYYIHALNGLGKFKERTVFEIIKNAILFIFSIILIIHFRSAGPYLAGLLTIQTIADLYFLYKTTNFLKNDIIDKGSFPFAVKLSLSELVNNIKGQSDKIIVRNVLSLSDTANLNVSLTSSDQIYALIKNVSTSLFPKSQEIRRPENKFKFLFFLGTIIVVACLSMILLLPVLIPIVYSGKYINAILLAQLFTIVSGLKSVNFIFQKIEQMDKFINGTLYSSTFTPLIEIALVLIFITSFGLYGVFFAKIITEILNFLFLIYFFITEKRPLNR